MMMSDWALRARSRSGSLDLSVRCSLPSVLSLFIALSAFCDASLHYRRPTPRKVPGNLRYPPTIWCRPWR